MNYLVVGVEFRTSKKSGEPYYMLHLSTDFSSPKYGIGSRTSTEYVSKNIYPADLKVGDTVEVSFGRGFDSKAYVNGVRIVKGDVPTVEVKK